VVGNWWFVHTLCDGKIVRIEAYPDRSLVLEAVGVQE
jgi:ketosteroid isomerase-like protein